MENIFDNKKIYIISSHAKARLCERGNCSFDKAEEECLNYIYNGVLVLETEKFRYYRNGNLFFPCKKEDGYENIFTVTTVLEYDSMVESRFQKIIERYDFAN